MEMKLQNLNVKISIIKNLKHEGEFVNGLSFWPTGKVLISAAVPRKTRKRIILHELTHLWFRLCGGMASTEEGACDMFGSLMGTILDQWEEIGGDAAIEAMTPELSKVEVLV